MQSRFQMEASVGAVRNNQGKRRRAAKLIGMCLVFVLLLAACSGNNGGPSNPADPQNTNNNSSPSQPGGESGGGGQEPVTIKLIASDAAGQILKARAEAFTKLYPWITVELLEPEWSPDGIDKPILEKVAALQAAGTPADIVRLEDLTVAINGGVIEDLQPYMEQEPSLRDAKYREGILENFIYDGKQYAVPIESASFLVYVNTDLLDKHGMEMPANDWTYDDMFEMMRSATNASDTEYGLNTNMHSNFLGLIYSYANGSSPNLYYLDEGRKQSLLNTPAVQNDLKQVQEIIVKNKLLPSEEEGSKVGIDHINQGFTQGKALFSIEGIWVFQDLQKNLSFNWDILPMPVGKKAQATIHALPAYSLLSSSRNKEAAMKFLAFTASEEYGKLNIDMGGLPFIESAELDSYLANHANFEGKNKAALQTISEMCCKFSGALIPGIGMDYLQPIYDFQYAIMRQSADVTARGTELAERFNQRTAELRKQIGME